MLHKVVHRESQIMHSENEEIAEQKVLVEQLEGDLYAMGEQIAEYQDEWNAYDAGQNGGDGFQDCQDDYGAGNWHDESAEFQNSNFAARAAFIPAKIP